MNNPIDANNTSFPIGALIEKMIPTDLNLMLFEQELDLDMIGNPKGVAPLLIGYAQQLARSCDDHGMLNEFYFTQDPEALMGIYVQAAHPSAQFGLSPSLLYILEILQQLEELSPAGMIDFSIKIPEKAQDFTTWYLFRPIPKTATVQPAHVPMMGHR